VASSGSSLQDSINQHIQSIEEDEARFKQLASASKRAHKKSEGEKVGHLMFRKSEAVKKHQMAIEQHLPSQNYAADVEDYNSRSHDESIGLS
jgi:hypothetical protein